jgi:hypothetical protein
MQMALFFDGGEHGDANAFDQFGDFGNGFFFGLSFWHGDFLF